MCVVVSLSCVGVFSVPLAAAAMDETEILFIAALRGEFEAVSQLVDAGVDVNAKDENGDTVLIVAAGDGLLGVVEVLLENGADVHAKNDLLGRTALHLAALNGHPAVVELLATHGADANAEDDEGWTPVHCAALPGRDEEGNVVEPDIGIINYLLRETGAIVPLAKSVVKAHYRRERGPVAHRTRGTKRRQAPP